MSGRNPKPLSLIQGHRSKEEKKAREEAEKALTPDGKFQKWARVQNDKTANSHFNKLRKAFGEIGLTDVLFEAVLNRYCILLSECESLEHSKEDIAKAINELKEKKGEMEFSEYMSNFAKLNDLQAASDRNIAKKRDQLLQIEKECLLTPQGKLRGVPKKPEEKKATGIEAYRNRRNV